MVLFRIGGSGVSPVPLTRRTGKMPVPLETSTVMPAETSIDSLLDLFIRGDLSLSEIARQAGCSMLELARVMAQPEQMMQLQQLATLNATYRDLQLGKYKANAMVKLAQLSESLEVNDADEARAAETMRKACVDLLKLPSEALKGDLLDERDADVDVRETPKLMQPTEDQILRALERMACSDDEATTPSRAGSTRLEEVESSEVVSRNAVGKTHPAKNGNEAQTRLVAGYADDAIGSGLKQPHHDHPP